MKIIFLESSDNIIVAESDYLVTTIGIHNLIILCTPNITFVCPKSDIRTLIDELRKANLEEYILKLEACNANRP